MTDQTQSPVAQTPSAGHINKPLFAITGGFIAVFCLLALFDLETLSAIVDSSFAFSAKYFGLYWQVHLLATFLIGLVLIVLPGSRAMMGSFRHVPSGPGCIGSARSLRRAIVSPMS